MAHIEVQDRYGRTIGQLDITGRDAPASPPRYDRDANAESVRLFEPAPTQMPGQTYMQTDTNAWRAA